MSGNETRHSITGGWLGAYYYDNRLRPPVRFEATFTAGPASGHGEVESNVQRFGGSILDDENGNGTAMVTHGIQQGNFVRFVKVYAQPAPGLYPIQYVGTLSEDGRLMSGHWKLTLSESRRARGREITGTWEARRLWHADTNATSESEDARRELTNTSER